MDSLEFLPEDNTWDTLQVMLDDLEMTVLEHLCHPIKRKGQAELRCRADKILIDSEGILDRGVRRVRAFKTWCHRLTRIEKLQEIKTIRTVPVAICGFKQGKNRICDTAKNGSIFYLTFEEGEITVRLRISPPEKVRYTIDVYSKERSTGVEEFLRVDFMLTNPPWVIDGTDAVGDIATRYDKTPNDSVMDFGIQEVRLNFIGVWMVQR
eukprot:augustus_masked-scaffold_138-processed-gene-0.0-mRNA-1 protein AED:1.00 eAED:1.00 QI:0/0/0/0/1/1/2/0/208